MFSGLSEELANFFTALSAHDVDAALGFFAEDACVADERRMWQGKAAVREWLSHTSATYRPRYTLISTHGGEVPRVDVRVEGQFPNSPLHFSFAFTVIDSHIARLEIS